MNKLDDIFWLVPGRLGGRQGPNQRPWNLQDFGDSKVTLIVSLTERMVNSSYMFAEFGIDHVCMPLPKNAPPLPGDKIEISYLLPRIFDLLEHHLENPSSKIVVHCSSGKDRTGLMFCYYLMRKNRYSVEEAISAIRLLIPRLLSADGWEQMGRELLAATAFD